MMEMLQDMKQRPPMAEKFYKTMEWHLCLFLIGFAFFMGWVAIKETTATWLFWKTGGFYVAFGGFMIFEMIYIRFFLRGLKK